MRDRVGRYRIPDTVHLRNSTMKTSTLSHPVSTPTGRTENALFSNSDIRLADLIRQLLQRLRRQWQFQREAEERFRQADHLRELPTTEKHRLGLYDRL